MWRSWQSSSFNTKGLPFESSQRHFFKWTYFLFTVEKTKIKKKEAGNGTLKKYVDLLTCWPNRPMPCCPVYSQLSTYRYFFKKFFAVRHHFLGNCHFSPDFPKKNWVLCEPTKNSFHSKMKSIKSQKKLCANHFKILNVT